MNQAFGFKPTLHQNLKEILKVTVETTRKTLNCDRVIIYDANSLPQAGVLVESVDAKCSSLLGRTIKDPFLGKDYLEMYHGGMSVTIDDIYVSDKSGNELKDLEKLGIKSVAIAPIAVENKLLAFLVAHQCFQAQPWDLKAVNFLAEKANIAGLNISNLIKAEKPKNVNSAQQIMEIEQKQHSPTVENQENNQSHKQQQVLVQNKTNRLFAEVKNKIAKKLELQDILNTTVAEMSRLLKCDRVFVYSLDEANYGVVVAESVVDGWTKALGKTIDDPYFVTRYLAKYRHCMVHVWDDTYDEDTPPCYLQQLETLEVKAGMVAPLVKNGQLFGLLIAHHCSDTRSWQKQEINWITEIANHIGNMLEYTKLSDDNNQEEQQQLADTQKQIEAEMMWTEYFPDVIQQIRQSLKTEDILKTTVREIQTVFNCDRVLIYSLDRERYGTIVAESVSPGWTKAEGRVIKDPCFEAKYLEKYYEGRFRAWNNIYEAGMSRCYIEQLEQLEVKANLVVPIIKEGKLFGLLAAQQCSNPRQWQQSEIRWLSQIALQVGFALDNAQLIADAQKLRQQAEEERKWTEYFTDAVQQIRQSLKTKDVLQSSVREVRRVLNCDRVVIYSLNQDNYGIIAAESVTHGWTRAEGRVIKDPCFETKYLHHYRDGRVRAWSNIYEAGMSNCYIEQLEKLEVKANLVTPIIHQGKLLGLLVAHQCSNFRQWQQTEIRWLTQIAAQVGFALDNAQLLEQLEQATKDTQAILARAVNSSSHIQRAVQNVVGGLENFSNSCQGFSEMIDKIKDLSKQLAQQSMKVTRAINLSQIEGNNQNSVIDLSDTIFSLMQELFETTAKIEPLFANIKTEITEKTTALESETQELTSGVDDFQTASQKLERIVAFNHEMSNLMEHISNSLETQIQSSTFTQDSVQELADITERISQQSVAIIQSFN